MPKKHNNHLPDYYSNWEKDDYDCQRCGWSGKGADCPQGECFTDLVEMDCPKCHKCLIVVMFPTLNDMRDNWGELDKAEKMQYLIVEKHNEDFEDSRLKSLDQLPDLEGDDLVLVWDIDDRQSGGNTLIKFGEKILWRETAFFEGYWRFIEISELLKEKYQDQLQDLVPTRKSELYLYGDKITSPRTVKKCREKLALYAETAS